ncbi:hypothetical protein EZV62_006899 [Acer yangbiense]|uniref:F-box domain-containing protein n=1 Tax=Acer yangbiense TaxID=1000413 RepID=A0A5C7I8Z9_9ROSI|nr:hypothetical protein EZV62_006899 [Acer yangbiense]
MFSWSPISPDCMVIVFSIEEDGKLEIQICPPKDKSWKTFEFWDKYKRFSRLQLAYKDVFPVKSYSRRLVVASNVDLLMFNPSELSVEKVGIWEIKISIDKMNNAEWGDLPKDIVRLIMEKLVWSDRFRMGLLCKSWQECIHEIQNTHEFLPWVMAYDWDRWIISRDKDQTYDGGDSLCKLCDPNTKTSYIVKEAAILKNRDLWGASPHHSRNGWVLFSTSFSKPFYVFFYSPFTNEVIKLPILKKVHFQRAMFSSSPKSPDCMVIALSNPEKGKLEIQTCKSGDKSWKMFEFFGEFNRFSIIEVAYIGESIYCIFSNGNMGIFNVKHEEWKMLSERSPFRSYDERRLVVASNGNLLLSNLTELPFWRFDISKMNWVEVEEESMKKQVIFNDDTPCSMSVPAMGNAKESGGKLYCVDYHCPAPFCCFYRDEIGTASEDYKWMEKEHDKILQIWIQPPFLKFFESF